MNGQHHMNATYVFCKYYTSILTQFLCYWRDELSAVLGSVVL